MNHTDVISPIEPSLSNPWTSRELQLLRENAHLGAESVADLLERSVTSVKWQAHAHRISLRRAGSRRGAILGQPRGASLVDAGLGDLRAAAIAGDVNLERLERRARKIASGAPLCPQCVIRPIEVELTGTCEDCHLKALALAHALEADRIAAGQLLDRERQRKHRAKEKAS